MKKLEKENEELKKTVENLLESERMYRLLAQNAIEVIWTMDLDGNFTYISPSVEHLRGFTREEAEKMPLEETMTEESYFYAMETLAGYLAMDPADLPRSKTMELEQICKDGSTVWTEVTVRMIQEEDGVITALQGTTRDITERKKAEEALMHSEEKYRLMVKNSPDLIVLADNEGTTTFMSPNVKSILGYTQEEFVGKGFPDILHPDDLDMAFKAYQRIVNGEELVDFQYRVITKDGGVHWVSHTASPIIQNGVKSGIQMNIRDITKEIETRDALKASEERFRMFYEQAPLAYQSLDTKGNIIEVNKAWVDLFGYEREDVREVNFERFLAPGFSDRFRRTLEFLEKNEEFHNVELDILTKKGAKVTVSMNARVGLDENSRHVQSYFILYDITERKHSERAMRKRSMRFPIEEGAVYCIKEPKCALGREVLRDLLSVGYSASIITRDPNFQCSPADRLKIDLQWIGTRGGGLAPEPGLIIEYIENLTDARAVLVDCLDYLITKNSFDTVLGFVQEIREIAYLMGHIIIISVPGGVLPKQKMEMLQNECRHMESSSQRKLSEDLYQILKFVYENNVTGLKPAYSEVQTQFRMSKPTVRKKLGFLNSTGYLIETKKGRRKLLELTEKGKGLFL